MEYSIERDIINIFKYINYINTFTDKYFSLNQPIILGEGSNNDKINIIIKYINYFNTQLLINDIIVDNIMVDNIIKEEEKINIINLYLDNMRDALNKKINE